MTTPPVQHQTPPAALAPSLVRTLLPFLAGLIGAWLVDRFGLPIEGELAGGLVTAAIGYLYYVVARFLEVFASEKWGYVLGFRKTPVYADPPATVVIEEVDGRHEAGYTDLVFVGALIAVAGLLLWLAAEMEAVGGIALVVGVVILAFGVAGDRR